jgi:hypothetical protein
MRVVGGAVGRVVFVVPGMVGHLVVEGGFQQSLGELLQDAAVPVSCTSPALPGGTVG